jgi:hypothetical protein
MDQADVGSGSRPAYEKDDASGSPRGSPEKQCTIAELPVAAEASTGSRQ